MATEELNLTLPSLKSTSSICFLFFCLTLVGCPPYLWRYSWDMPWCTQCLHHFGQVYWERPQKWVCVQPTDARAATTGSEQQQAEHAWIASECIKVSVMGAVLTFSNYFMEVLRAYQLGTTFGWIAGCIVFWDVQVRLVCTCVTIHLLLQWPQTFCKSRRWWLDKGTWRLNRWLDKGTWRLNNNWLCFTYYKSFELNKCIPVALPMYDY